MGEYSYASITINKYFINHYIKQEFEKYSFDDCYKESDLIILSDPEASYGHFDGLEEWLIENCIPFDRHSDASYDSSGEIQKYRPELGNSYSYTVSCNNEPFVELPVLRNLLVNSNNKNIKYALEKLISDTEPEIKNLSEYSNDSGFMTIKFKDSSHSPVFLKPDDIEPFIICNQILGTRTMVAKQYHIEHDIERVSYYDYTAIIYPDKEDIVRDLFFSKFNKSWKITNHGNIKNSKLLEDYFL